MNAITRLEMRWRLRGEWHVVRELIGREAEIVDVYAADERLRCCSFQVGLFIDLDGEPWSDESTVDEPWMTMTWLAALDALARGELAAGATPWEESALVLQREGDVLTMEDVHPSGHVSIRRIQVSFAALCRRVVGEANVFADVVRAVRDEAGRRAARPGADAVLRERMRVIDQELPDEGEHGLGLVKALSARV